MSIFIPVLGGLAIFLFGMNLMGEGLQKIAGNRLKSIVGALTKNKVVGMLLGVVVTAIIQSSSATTVMVVGFVNAGIMTLSQAVGVIIGANVGTTITAQIIAFDIDKVTPILLFVGIIFIMISKEKKQRDFGEILIGLGLIFFGMNNMSEGLKPLSEQAWFQEAILKLNSPLVGIPVGVVLTTAVQSSSASIGLIQAFCKQGLMSITQAAPLLLGGNIGTTTTALISSIGANRNAKRAAVVHFLFNLIGTVFAVVLFNMALQRFVVYLTPDNASRQVANYHTLFNVINVMIQLPFSHYLAKAAIRLVPDSDEKERPRVVSYIDDRILETPSIALIQAKREVVGMTKIVYDSFCMLEKLIEKKEMSLAKSIHKNEHSVNALEREILEFLVKLSNRSLSDSQHEEVFVMQDMINDLERMADHVENITELFEDIYKEDLSLSTEAKREFRDMFVTLKEMLKNTCLAYENNETELAEKTLPLEDKIDHLEKLYRHNHIRRINKQECHPTVGVLFLDMLANMERISDHGVNICNYVLHKEI